MSLLPARTGTLFGNSAGHPLWVWWVAQPDRLQAKHRDLLERGADRVFGVSIVSCWEVAKLMEYGKLKLDRHVGIWIESALAGPGVTLLHLNPQIVVESTQLPQPLHRDPADQLLVATARGLAVSNHDRRRQD